MKPTTLLIIVPLVAAVFGGCRDRVIQIAPPATPVSADHTSAEVLVMRTYGVPPGSANRLQSVLSSLFFGVKDKVAAKATLGPNGELVVVAPIGIQTGVEALLERMKTSAPPSPPPTVEMDYWLVLGRPAKERKDGPGLSAVKQALDAIESANGPMEFIRHDHIQLKSMTDHEGHARGVYTEAIQVVTVFEDTIVANVTLHPTFLRSRLIFETRIQLAPGKLVVLGAAGIDPKDWPKPGSGDGAVTLFYVVRATIKDV